MFHLEFLVMKVIVTDHVPYLSHYYVPKSTSPCKISQYHLSTLSLKNIGNFTRNFTENH